LAEQLIYRSLPFGEAKVKLAKREWEGYASTFGNEDSYGDIIEAGAFKKTITERGPRGANKIKGLWEHYAPFGTIQELREDEYGLWMKGKASDTTENQDRLKYMADGVVDSMSIGFSIPEGKSWWEDDGGWYGIRHIEEVKLYEVSVVMFPANELAAIAGVRKSMELNQILKHVSAEDLISEIKGFEGIDIRAIDRALNVLGDLAVLKSGGEREKKQALRGQREPVQTTPPTDEPPKGDSPEESDEEKAAREASEMLHRTLGGLEIRDRLAATFS